MGGDIFARVKDGLSGCQGTTEEAAKDIAAFVAIFFNHFTEYKGRAFHLAGESYGVNSSSSYPMGWLTEGSVGTVSSCVCRGDL